MAKNDDSKSVRCSFCGKSQDMVRKLIAGPNNVFICDECTSLCLSIIEEEDYYSQPNKKGGKSVSKRNLPKPAEIKAKLDEKNVELCGDEYAGNIIDIALATDEDWGKEYLDYKMSIKTVDNVEEAIAHINTYSTGHSEAIITNDYNSAQKFTKLVNSSAVYVNASTRFTDGGQFGFGAEIGISTQKLHARGPIGLPELTTTKFVIRGNGQIR